MVKTRYLAGSGNAFDLLQPPAKQPLHETALRQQQPVVPGVHYQAATAFTKLLSAP